MVMHIAMMAYHGYVFIQFYEIVLCTYMHVPLFYVGQAENASVYMAFVLCRADLIFIYRLFIERLVVMNIASLCGAKDVHLPIHIY